MASKPASRRLADRPAEPAQSSSDAGLDAWAGQKPRRSSSGHMSGETATENASKIRRSPCHLELPCRTKGSKYTGPCATGSRVPGVGRPSTSMAAEPPGWCTQIWPWENAVRGMAQTWEPAALPRSACTGRSLLSETKMLVKEKFGATCRTCWQSMASMGSTRSGWQNWAPAAVARAPKKTSGQN